MLNRRAFLCLIAMTGIAPGMSLASEDVLDLDWSDMIPPGGDSVTQRLQSLGILPHDEMATLRAEQPTSSGVRTDFNGKIVRIPGYIVPLETSGSGVTEFILVPYVGACIHVPPPPANQLVFVTTQKPYESSGLFEAVNVTGMFGTASISTQLADIGYALSADLIEPYGR
ncbi:DUF3299 domain-containing protein [Sulfitobacter sp. JL08]|uniref:DUF3299 domain-containing protein n=1 Tax=unclassified Sulfitobacter TaxID=196795 RepID=UPI0020C775E1|nr:DUF3299 domain-containing protein [Sulfitobacter sp. JL08]